MFRVQVQIVLPLKKLKSLRDCYIRAMTPRHIERRASDPSFGERLRLHEKRLETIVMGDDYDSIASGKIEQRQSEWTKMYDTPLYAM